jgi:hypothetical protein
MAAEIFNYVKIIDYLMCCRKEQEGLLLSNKNMTHEGYEGLKTRQKRAVLGLALLFPFFFLIFSYSGLKHFLVNLRIHMDERGLRMFNVVEFYT